MGTYRVTIKPNGTDATTTVDVEAADEWKARTHAMGEALHSGFVFPSGSFVDYEVARLD